MELGRFWVLVCSSQPAPSLRPRRSRHGSVWDRAGAILCQWPGQYGAYLAEGPRPRLRGEGTATMARDGRRLLAAGPGTASVSVDSHFRLFARSLPQLPAHAHTPVENPKSVATRSIGLVSEALSRPSHHESCSYPTRKDLRIRRATQSLILAANCVGGCRLVASFSPAYFWLSATGHRTRLQCACLAQSMLNSPSGMQRARAIALCLISGVTLRLLVDPFRVSLGCCLSADRGSVKKKPGPRY